MKLVKLGSAFAVLLGIGATTNSADASDFRFRFGFGDRDDRGARPVYRPHYHAWQSRTFDCHDDAHQFERRMRRSGYETRMEHHGRHFHVSFRQCH